MEKEKGKERIAAVRGERSDLTCKQHCRNSDCPPLAPPSVSAKGRTKKAWELLNPCMEIHSFSFFSQFLPEENRDGTLLHELEAQNLPLFLSTLFGVSHSPQLARSHWLLHLLLLNVHLMIVSNKPALPTKTFSVDFSYCITFSPRGCVSCVCMCTAYRQM